MSRTSFIITIAGLAFSLALQETTVADTAGTLELCVNVGSALSIQGPVNPIPLSHDGNSGDKEFAPAVWTLVSNDEDGAICTFETSSPMVHQIFPLRRRNVRLTLAIMTTEPAADWTVTVPSDETDYAHLLFPKLKAAVAAESTGPGNCTVALVATFITGNENTLIPGDYCTTVTATISAK